MNGFRKGQENEPSSTKPSRSFSATAAILYAADALGQETDWIGVGGNLLWSNSANWNNGLPVPTDAAVIANGGTATINQPGAICGALQVGWHGVGTVQITGGSLILPVSVPVENIGEYGTGVFTQSGGTNGAINYGMILTVGGDPPYNGGSGSGTYNLNGGMLFADAEGIGDNSNGIFTQSGGTNSASSVWASDATLASSERIA